MNDNIKLCEEIIGFEFDRAIDKHGKFFKNSDEFMGAFYEELQEVKEEIKKIEIYVELLEKAKRQNNENGITDCLIYIRRYSKYTLLELAQICAIIDKKNLGYDLKGGLNND